VFGDGDRRDILLESRILSNRAHLTDDQLSYAKHLLSQEILRSVRELFAFPGVKTHGEETVWPDPLVDMT
jgi:hypothetical protein